VPINGSEVLIILVLALLLVGPERLPTYAQQVARVVREIRRIATDTGAKVRTELEPELQGLDLASFDPRTYDPRRIVRDAVTGTSSAAGSRAGAATQQLRPGQPAPFDDEAT